MSAPAVSREMDMPTIGSMTVPQVQRILAEHRRFIVALEKIIAIVGDGRSAAEYAAAEVARSALKG